MNPHDPKDANGQAKPQMHLIPTAGMEEQAKVHRYGAERYGPWNWRDGKVCVSTYQSAMIRHALAYRDGEDIDPESGCHHMGHIMANCAILLDAGKHGTLVDDRPGKMSAGIPSDPEAREPREWETAVCANGFPFRYTGPEMTPGEVIRCREILPEPTTESTPVSSSLTLEVGKWYEDRDGLEVGPMEENDGRYSESNPFRWGVRTYRSDGGYWADPSQGEDSFDLIREIPAPSAETSAFPEVGARLRVKEEGFQETDLEEGDELTVTRHYGLGFYAEHSESGTGPIYYFAKEWRDGLEVIPPIPTGFPPVPETPDALESLRSQHEIQGQHGNWNFDPYMHGMFNGLELALAQFENRPPDFREAPDVWLLKESDDDHLGIGPYQQSVPDTGEEAICGTCDGRGCPVCQTEVKPTTDDGREQCGLLAEEDLIGAVAQFREDHPEPAASYPPPESEWPEMPKAQDGFVWKRTKATSGKGPHICLVGWLDGGKPRWSEALDWTNCSVVFVPVPAPVVVKESPVREPQDGLSGESERQQWTCLLCGRNKFSRPGQPHNCNGQKRKNFKRVARRLGVESVWKPTSGNHYEPGKIVTNEGKSPEIVTDPEESRSKAAWRELTGLEPAEPRYRELGPDDHAEVITKDYEINSRGNGEGDNLGWVKACGTALDVPFGEVADDFRARRLVTEPGEEETETEKDANRFRWLLNQGIQWRGCYKDGWQEGEWLYSDAPDAIQRIDAAIEALTGKGGAK